MGFPGSTVVKKPASSAADARDAVRSLGQEDLLEEEMGTHSSVLAWEIAGQRSLVGHSPWGQSELDMIEQLNTHTHSN